MNSIDKSSSSSANAAATTRASSTSFWRKTGKPIPGRPNPSSRPPSNSSTISSHPHQHHFVAPHHAASPLKSSTARFQDYESSVSDAWDIRDDEGDDPILMSIPHANSAKIHSSPNTRVSSSISLHQNNVASKTNHSANDTALKTDEVQSSTHNKRVKIEKLLENSSINLDQLRKLAWSGLSPGIRNKIWRILCGYLPPNHSNRGEDVVSRKREEYQRYVEQYFLKREEQDASHQDTYRQIHIDIPRMSPVVGLFQQRTVQEIFERILYIWAIRHPASGYVQGINDLVTPFFLVFLHEYLPEGRNSVCPDIDLGNDLTEQQRDIIEADSFWCLTKVLDGIQDHYTFAQPGIQLKVKQLEELIKRIDAELHFHLVSHDVLYLQFAFRWMNNLLMREIPIKAVIRLWDTYLSEKNGFSHFHLYVTAAFLMKFKDEILRRKDFHTVLMFLQNLPTAKWGDEEIELIVAEAYQLSYLFADAPSHLSNIIKTNDINSNK
ncbi:TBC1 domain family member 22B [Lepeophtheirus salmonis]|uniref:TBC1 domain family, member 22B [Chinchilla lanigera] n=1 Tax=Lepeophtheirus salmonis TaxID=72036 RepID=A0A0K2V6S8_LEPSM|nr:TBC1 domain family member 22B-like [Lepeophtheirus salmonis]